VSFRLRALHGAVLWIAVTGCASAPGRLQAPKAVSGVELAPYAIFEECIALEQGERVAYRFESRLPVAFNIHFHEDNAVIMPVSRDGTISESGDFAADRKEIYCLTWEAGAGGSVLDYRMSPWPRQQ
jgi:FtsP/CotA-like multicopper oxidase with cupredoxin domain